MNISINPNYIEDFNGSDYVCMTRSTPQASSKLAAMVPVPPYSPKSTINSSSTTVGNPKHLPSGSVLSSDNPNAMLLTSKNLQTLQQQEQLATNMSQLNVGGSASEKASSVSPTPSQLSSGSNKRN